MPRILVMATTVSINRRRLRKWLDLLEVAPRSLSVVAMGQRKTSNELPARRVLVIPSTGRPGSLPVDLPAKHGQFEGPLGGNRVTRAVEVRLGRMLDKFPWRRAARNPSAWFARACMETGPVRRMFRSADIVVAADAPSAWAAWQLAQVEAGPEVVYGLDAALPIIARIRAERRP